MKKCLMAFCALVAVLVMMASTASAVEIYDWHLPGAEQGLAYGALPPPGLYYINLFWWTGDFKVTDNSGHSLPVKIEQFVEAPILLWNPGICPILGATYACALAQPYDMGTVRVLGTTLSGWQAGMYNTVIDPVILSWNIPCNLHVSASFEVGLNDGTTSPADSMASIGYKLYATKALSKDGASAYPWTSNGCYSFNPAVGISWLYGGWNLSFRAMYTIWSKDTDTDVQSGDELYTEYTATYTCGKWTFGLVAMGNNQLYNDTGNYINGAGNLVHGKILDSCSVRWAAGPTIGYNFGPCSVMFAYDFNIVTKNAPGNGDFAWCRLVIPLGNPFSWYK